MSAAGKPITPGDLVEVLLDDARDVLGTVIAVDADWAWVRLRGGGRIAARLTDLERVDG